jgi:hypothetical protein
MWLEYEEYKDNAPILQESEVAKFGKEKYIIRAWLSDWDWHVRGFPSRDIAISGDSNLGSLAFEIVKSFDFDSDHLFHFANGKNSRTTTELYEYGYEDIMGISTEDVVVGQVFTEKKKMYFTFDYGDNWHFVVKCLKVEDVKPNEDLPSVFNIQGEAPEQYPCPEDDDCD